MRFHCASRVGVVLCLSVAVCAFSSVASRGADIGFLVDPDEIVDQAFDQFWVQRLQAQGHNVLVLPANYQPDNPGAVTADIFIGSNDIGSGDFISVPNIARQFNLNPIDLTGQSNVEVSVLVAGGPEGFDVDIDYFRFRADEDGDGSYETLLIEFLPNDFGELQQVGGDEIILEPIFQEVTFSVPASISTLRLQVDPFTTAGAEQFGFDNIRVTSGATTIGSENFEGGAGQVGFTSVGQGVGGGNQFFDLSNAEGVDPDVVFEDFEGDVWFGGADVDANFAFPASFRLTDPRPFITYEDAVFDELQMALDPATGRSTGDTIVIADPAHPLAAGLTGDEFGEVFIYDLEQGITFIGSADANELGEGVEVVAVNLDGQAVIAVLEKGAIGIDGEPSPGQRIGIFPQDSGDGSLYSDDGLALLDAAVAYALASNEPPHLLDCNGDGVEDFGDLDCSNEAGITSDLLAQLNLLPGDLDGQGGVAFADFLILSANFGQALNKYPEGDIDGLGGVAFGDFLILSANFGQSAAGVAAAVPEPTGLSLILLGLSVSLAIRRRRT